MTAWTCWNGPVRYEPPLSNKRLCAILQGDDLPNKNKMFAAETNSRQVTFEFKDITYRVPITSGRQDTLVHLVHFAQHAWKE